MTKTILSMVAMHVVLLFVLLGSIYLIFDLRRYAFLGEFLILGVGILMGITAIAGLANHFRWVWRYLIVFFVLVLINLLIISWLGVSDAFMFKVTLYATIIGFILSVLMVIGENSERSNKNHSSTDYREIEEPEKPKTETKTVSATYSPGKYLASKSGNTYHSPKCDWGKRINKKNRVWYDSKDDAEAAGNKPHNCIAS